MNDLNTKRDFLRRLSVSVIIPTYNGAAWLDDQLALLQGQSIVPDEILVVDSSSSDQSVEIARRRGAKVMTISPGDFDHGTTRSMAGKEARGDILVYMTQDALPADVRALENVLYPLAVDEKVAVSYGRQLPYADATLFAQHLRFKNYPPVSSRRALADKEKYGVRTFFTSNSFAAYRKSALSEIGFFKEGLLFGEDTHAVTKLLQAGYIVEYRADARVYHSHNYSWCQELRRYFDIGVFHTRETDFYRQFGSPSGEGMAFVRSELAYLISERKYLLLPVSLLRNMGKFIGYQLGRGYIHLPRKIVVFLSMNRRWWTRIDI
ncbi:MAG: glycosyltransferase [Desulfobulbaceae bacterium]|nr:glycosyltransferase [Desulfobulbaceae bacterium]